MDVSSFYFKGKERYVDLFFNIMLLHLPEEGNFAKEKVFLVNTH